PYLGDYVGYDISGVPAGTHLGLPSGALTFIVTIGEPLRQVDAGRFDVLLAGLHLRPTRIRHNGTMAGIQINVSPFAPRALFALTAAELTHRTVGLDAVSRPLAAELHDRVNAAATWAERFAAIDAVLLRVLSDDASPRPEVGRAWAQIVRS
ncbi:AraC family transcriptional regulator, partial [Geobacillus sp. MMMUD3]|nr:AraC family transcriptional regulator [Geobacillus sp. MMMUD3]